MLRDEKSGITGKKVGVYYYDVILIILFLDLVYFFAIRLFNIMPTIISRFL